MPCHSGMLAHLAQCRIVSLKQSRPKCDDAGTTSSRSAPCWLAVGSMLWADALGSARSRTFSRQAIAAAAAATLHCPNWVLTVNDARRTSVRTGLVVRVSIRNVQALAMTRCIAGAQRRRGSDGTQAPPAGAHVLPRCEEQAGLPEGSLLRQFLVALPLPPRRP